MMLTPGDTIRATIGLKKRTLAMAEKIRVDRRNFLKQAAGAVGAAALPETVQRRASARESQSEQEQRPVAADVSYPRRFSGDQLRMISFPLGGVAAGSIGLGGRGQLVNWEIFNRPNKGLPASLCVSVHLGAGGKPQSPSRECWSRAFCRPTRARTGWARTMRPGLSRLESATFTGEYPLAHIDFEDTHAAGEG